MYKNLRDFLSHLEREGELVRISEPVSSNLEIAEITDRVSSQPDGGVALLFENTETKFPVVTNMFGSDRRIATALGVEGVNDFTVKIDALLGDAMSPKKGLMDKLKMIPLLKNAASWMPKRKKGRGDCQYTIVKGDDIDLSQFPILKCAPYDGAPFITLPLVHTFDPHTGARNVGMYRMQVMGRNTTGMHWHKHKTGERHYQAYKELGERMPVTVVLGGDPAYTYSATAPLPDGIDEYILSGFIRGKGVELVKCITNDHYVPIDADIVIEGYVDPSEDKVIEGPFADHTGFYSLEDYFPLFHVTCITYRKDAIYPATLVGIPPKEDAYIAKATEKIFLSPIKAVMQPEMTDMWLPQEGVAHNIALVNIVKRYEGQGVKVGLSLLGAGQMMFSKCIIVSSGNDKGLSNPETIKEIISRVDVDRDITITTGVMDILDHTSPSVGFGGKMVIDATNEPIPHELALPKDYILSDGIIAVNDSLAKDGYSILLINMGRDVPDFKSAIDNFCNENRVLGVKFVIALDGNVPLDDIATVAWLASSNFDAKRDSAIVNGRLIIDSRAKFGGINGFNRQWPNVIAMDEATIKLVDTKWNKYGLGALIDSPTHKYKPLLFQGRASVDNNF